MIRIWLFAVTALVFTLAVVDPTSSTKLPAGAESHFAGEAAELQFDNVPKDETTSGCPVTLQSAPIGQAESTEFIVLANSKTSLSD